MSIFATWIDSGISRCGNSRLPILSGWHPAICSFHFSFGKIDPPTILRGSSDYRPTFLPLSGVTPSMILRRSFGVPSMILQCNHKVSLVQPYRDYYTKLPKQRTIFATLGTQYNEVYLKHPHWLNSTICLLKWFRQTILFVEEHHNKVTYYLQTH